MNFVRTSQPLLLLDAGCGEGEILFYHHRAFPDTEIIGLDISKDALTIAKNTVKNVEFIVGDMRSLPFKEKVFDTVLCLEVLEHCKNPSELLDELSRLANRNLILSVPHSLLFRLGNLLTMKNLSNLGEDKDHIYRFNKSLLKSLLKGRFENVKIARSSVWLIAVCERDQATSGI